MHYLGVNCLEAFFFIAAILDYEHRITWLYIITPLLNFGTNFGLICCELYFHNT